LRSQKSEKREVHVARDAGQQGLPLSNEPATGAKQGQAMTFPELQRQAIAALGRKCEILWTILDSIQASNGTAPAMSPAIMDRFQKDRTP
jgi:hypothetical protein